MKQPVRNSPRGFARQMMRDIAEANDAGQLKSYHMQELLDVFGSDELVSDSSLLYVLRQTHLCIRTDRS